MVVLVGGSANLGKFETVGRRGGVRKFVFFLVLVVRGIVGEKMVELRGFRVFMKVLRFS